MYVYMFTDRGYMVTGPCDYEEERFKWQWTELQQFRDAKGRCISHSTDPYPEEHQRQALMFTKCTNQSNLDVYQWQKWTSFIWLHD